MLSSPLPSNSDPGIRKEVIMTLCQLLRSFPRPLTPHIMNIVTPVWNILVSNTPVYPLCSFISHAMGSLVYCTALKVALSEVIHMN